MKFPKNVQVSPVQGVEYSMSIRMKNDCDTKIKPALMKNDKDYIIAIDGGEGCLSGDTEIQISRGKLSRRYTIERLYNHYNNNPDKVIPKNKLFNLDIPTYVRSYNGKEIRLHKIKDVFLSGVKQTFLIELESGKFIKATSNHKFINRDGWKRLDNLNVGDELLTDTLKANKSGIPVFDKIISIKPHKVEKVYDIECEEPYHNFVANGIVVHNSGKSTFAFQLGKYIDPTLTIRRVVFSADDFRDAIYKAKKGQVIIYDEAFTGLSSRSSLSGINRALVSLMMQMRQKNLCIILVLPTFFLLDRYAALFRSRILIHVYENKGIRGFYRVYNRKKKKMIYLTGKKDYTYRVRTKYTGRFYGKFALGDENDEKEYRKKKAKALEETHKDPMTTAQVKYREQRDLVIYILRKRLNITYTALSNLLGDYDLEISHQQLAKICGKFGDTGKINHNQYTKPTESETEEGVIELNEPEMIEIEPEEDDFDDFD